jgi:hypothetical protein
MIAGSPTPQTKEGDFDGGSAAVNGAVATASADGYVEFTGVAGSHTWAW